MRLRFCGFLAASLFLAIFDASVYAQGVTPPKLVEFVEATYPEEAKKKNLTATVELELTISAEGQVTDTKVVEPAGNGFDEAAVEAAKKFVFEPAKRGDQAIPSIIRYRYVFELREVPTPSHEPEEPAPSSAPPSPNSAPAPLVVPTQDTESFGAVASIDPPPREVTRRTVFREELTRIPGTRSDALRAVELLPGVARPPFGIGALIVRGSAPGDSEVFFDGIPVPLLYHFGGLTSFVNSRLLDRIELYPGNFSVRYGRRIGGILEVASRDPVQDKIHGVAEINLIDTYVMAESPLGKNWSFAASARRSLIDLVFGAVVPKGSFDVVAAPVYYDYQLFLNWKPSPKDRVQWMVYGSSDRLKLVLKEPSDSDPVVRGNVQQSVQFHYVQAKWRRMLLPSVEQEINFSMGPNLINFNLGNAIRFDAHTLQVYGRAEWKARLTPAVQLISGLDLFVVPFDIKFLGPPPRQSEGSTGNFEPITNQEQLDVRARDTAYRPALYVESDLQPRDWLRIVLGMRLDYFAEIQKWAFDPRLSSFVNLSEKTRIKFGIGIFSQPPEFQESNSLVGNPHLKPIHAAHVSAGWDYLPVPGMRIGVEGFYKRLWNRVVETPGGVAPKFNNEGVGRIYGLEISGRIEPRGRFFGYLSYTLSRSERRDGDELSWRLFDFDQTHILTLAGVYRLGRGWEAGLTVRVVSGNPLTPIVGGIYNANTDLYEPISGKINSARNPLFNRLDVRIQKQWTFRSWKLALFLDVQNAYNAKNREAVIYNYDYTKNKPVRGLPIIPSLGVRGEL